MPTAWRVVVGLGTLVGLTTGIGTIVGWLVSSQSLDEVALRALEIAGAVYIQLVFAYGLFDLIRGQDPLWRRHLVYLAVAIVALNGLIVFPWNPTGLRILGGLGLLVAALAAYVTARQIARSHKKCPSCAETVKAEAKVCRYCGFRFA